MSLGPSNTAFRYDNGQGWPFINPQTADYTLTPEDNGALVVMNKGSAVTVTIPTLLPVGFRCRVLQKGAGQVTFAASGTTIRNYDGQTKTAGQYAVVDIDCPEVDVFYLSGRTGA